MDSPTVKQRLALPKILSPTLDILHRNRRYVILIYLLCFFLPFIGHELFFSLRGKDLVSLLPHIDLELSLIPTLVSFFVQYVLSYFGLIYLSIVGYGALILIATRPPANEDISPKELLVASLRLSPRLILAFLSLICLALLTVVVGRVVPIFLPLVFISIALGIALGIMIPVLLVMAPHSTLTTVYHALTLKYCPHRRWSLFFALLTVFSLEAFSLSALSLLSGSFLNTDQPSDFWSKQFLDIFPFSPAWLVHLGLLTATTALFSVLPAILSVTIYNRYQATE